VRDVANEAARAVAAQLRQAQRLFLAQRTEARGMEISL
jgi:hypothetical protein